MITPRATRLVRVADLQDFRRVIARLAMTETPTAEATAILVPTRAAADVLAQFIDVEACSIWGSASVGPLCVTRDQFYDALHDRLPNAPRRLTVYERDAMAQAAAEQAAADVADLPFQIRPGLVAELLRFYDQLRRQSQHVRRFEELITEALGGADDDRGAQRLLQQTRFLARAFREYERQVAASGAIDEHGLRERLLSEPSVRMFRHVIVTVPDWIADPSGLFVADFDFLSRVPNLALLDIVSTASVLGSGFHERLHNWWPGLDEVDGSQITASTERVRPMLVKPAGDADVSWFTHRDREEELVAVADRLAAAPREHDSWPRVAVVFKRPLPYLYLAPVTLTPAGIPYRVFDELPLAAEPVVATVDLVLDAVESDCSRDALIALLRSAHLRLCDPAIVTREAINGLNRTLSMKRYLGGVAKLEALELSTHDEAVVRPALTAALDVARTLSVLRDSALASRHLTFVLDFLERHFRPLDDDDPLASRERRARDLLADLLRRLIDAHERHYDPVWASADLGTAIRRWIGDHTCPSPVSDAGGVRLLDDQAARYGDFDDLTIVGLIENDWPERTRRNIFYAPALLKALGWPSERDRRSAADARFVDLMGSATARVELSTFTLDDEAIVTRSVQLDEVPHARLSTIEADTDARVTIRLKPDSTTDLWTALRAARRDTGDLRFHGHIGSSDRGPWSVSALETYLGCPFKFFAQHVLGLEEEPDDEEVMDPRKQGQFVHKVFEEFFSAWQNEGHGAITADSLETARQRFVQVVESLMSELPEGEAALERTRLLGSSAAAGLGEAVFRMEAERPVPVVERLLEHRLKGDLTMAIEGGSRRVTLKGKVDRLDLLADGTFRLIDYKLGWPPDRNRALQLPIYGIWAEQHLRQYRGRTWSLGEAVYLAFKGPKRVVPLFANAASRDETLTLAQQRLSDTLDAIARGEFPPTPDDVYRCETCSFAAVCRKDYVGDV